MQTPSLIIFANFRIDNEERYLRMQDSLASFKDICAYRWVINIRGKFKEQASIFLKTHLGAKLVCSQLESKLGWFHDTRSLLKEIDSDFVLFWLEDHINLASIENYQKILIEMEQNDCDQLTYSWWFQERKDRYKAIKTSESGNLDYFEINKNSARVVEQNLGSYFYAVSIPGIFKVDFFKNIIESNHPRLKRWPKVTPFDFEKRSTDALFLNFTYALPKFELFVAIDDNNYSKSKYCLIDRGLYPDRMTRDDLLVCEGREKERLPLPEVLKHYFRALATFLKRLGYTLR